MAEVLQQLHYVSKIATLYERLLLRVLCFMCFLLTCIVSDVIEPILKAEIRSKFVFKELSTWQLGGFKYVYCCFKNEKKNGLPRMRFAQRSLFNRSQ